MVSTDHFLDGLLARMGRASSSAELGAASVPNLALTATSGTLS